LFAVKGLRRSSFWTAAARPNISSATARDAADGDDSRAAGRFGVAHQKRRRINRLAVVVKTAGAVFFGACRRGNVKMIFKIFFS
jgi:hypothetical protein